ncbi:MAG: trypsin-like peptidase domain-containing protein [Erysipelotrichaceae bacterium]|nr:trypsin-like peptidase domain-containing protein [Erysipelotrichaceae bacterium]
MSEYRNPEDAENMNDIPFSEPEKPVRKTVNKKQNKGANGIAVIAASAVISTMCGLGGGWFAYTHLGAGTPTVIYESANTENVSPATSVSGSGSAMTIADVAAKASPSVVEIVTETTQQSYGFFGGTYTAQAAGSGVIISSDGYIITNNHVIENAESITVTLYDGKTYDAELVGTDAKTDIAVIKIQAAGLTAATIGDSSKIATGDTAIVIGNPLGTLGGSVTNGIISATSREIVIGNESMELIQTNATINNGNSGGGLFDGSGNLIGIVNAKDSGTTSSGALIEGIGFAIPVNTAMDVASELMQYGQVTDRPTIGIYLQELTSDTQNYKAGLYITDTITGSGAEAAGLQPYDRIIAIDDTEVSSYADLSIYLRSKNVGDVISLKVIREGQELTFDVTLTGTLSDSTATHQEEQQQPEQEEEQQPQNPWRP